MKSSWAGKAADSRWVGPRWRTSGRSLTQSVTAIPGKTGANLQGFVALVDAMREATRGLRMVYEMYLQLSGRAGARQRQAPTWGVTHNLGGFPSQNVAAIAVLGQYGA